MSEERIQKVLARAGLGSRRASEDLIREGRVRVNGRVATLGDRADPARDRVEVDGSLVPLDPTLRYMALNKPAGVLTTMGDPVGREDVTRFLPEGSRLFPVGRLDRDTEGLLLLTNDGELGNRITHPRYGVEKEYLAEVEGPVGPRELTALRRGVLLEDGVARALGVRAVGRSRGRTALRVVMGEGRKREVRRLLAAIGLPVHRLVRIRVGPIRLGRMRPGEVRDLTPREVRDLFRATGR
ncbi:MAG: rRNA pseudouridine synthase [Actinobacteria bacterium]|nr:rRNA pseudouridine synthase [Actinomycetota bacterium]